VAVSASALRERRSPGLGGRIIAELKLDAPLLAGLLLICGFGLVVLWSASGQNPALLVRQSIRIGIAFAVMVAIAQVPPKVLRFWSPWLFVLGLALLAVVLWVGDVGKGAQRWLDFGVVRFQPSEIMKLAVPMMAAWYLRPLASAAVGRAAGAAVAGRCCLRC
jgi:rod shape determining protein RodA